METNSKHKLESFVLFVQTCRSECFTIDLEIYQIRLQILEVQNKNIQRLQKLKVAGIQKFQKPSQLKIKVSETPEPQRLKTNYSGTPHI